jgi:hypothetical protein
MACDTAVAPAADGALQLGKCTDSFAEMRVGVQLRRFARLLLSLSWGGRETRLSTPRSGGHSFSGPGAQGGNVDDPNLTSRHFNEPRLFKRLECALHDLAY